MTKPSSFNSLHKATFWQGYWYLYFVLVALMYVAFSFFLVSLWLFLPLFSSLVDEAIQEAPTWYPQELVLTFSTGGALTTNVQEPYVVSSLDSLLTFNRDEPVSRLYDHVLTIDTSAAIDDFFDYNSHALLTGRAFVAEDKSEGVRSFFYSKFMRDADEPLVINYDKYMEAVTALTPYAHTLPWILGIGGSLLLVSLPWLVAFFWSAGLLVYLLVVSLFCLLLSTLRKKKFSFRRLYILGMYGVTLPLVTVPILGFLGLDFPLLFTLLFLVMMWLVLGAKQSVATKKKK